MNTIRVLGIDAGSFNTPSWLAFLEGDLFTLSMTTIRPDRLDLSWLDSREVAAVAVDAPQGLPARGRTVRVADKAAGTPTRRLPRHRAEMERERYDSGTQIMYAQLIRLGVDFFWHHQSRVYSSGEFDGKVAETYPRAVLSLLTGMRDLPSKRSDAFAYCSLVMGTLVRLGLRCPGVEIPSVDQADAMLCAYAARCALEGNMELVGEAPILDDKDRVLREGYIVLPKVT